MSVPSVGVRRRHGWRSGRGGPGRGEEEFVRVRRSRRRGGGDAGVVTIEYAVLMTVAAAFALVLLKVLSGAGVFAKLESMVTRALSG
jgi:hypothetical protein